MKIDRTYYLWALILVCLFPFDTCRAAVYINEFMASTSTNGLVEDPNEAGEYPDWIELYNSGGSPVDISGWYMTDDPGTPNKFQITANSIPAGGFLLLYADKDPEQGSNHLDFALSSGGEAIGLSSDGVVFVDSIIFDSQNRDESYGRFPDSSDTWMVMTNASPDATNKTGYLGEVADTKFSIDRGYFTNTFQVAITSDTATAQIYFTTDFSEPSDTNGLLYTNSITVTNTTVLRAAAFKAGWKETDIDTHTYIFHSDVLVQSQDQTGFPTSWGLYTVDEMYAPSPTNPIGSIVPSDYEMNPNIVTNPVLGGQIPTALKELPSVCINLPMENIFGLTNGFHTNAIYAHTTEEGTNWDRAASVEMISTNGESEFQVNCAIRIMGGWSVHPSSTPKHSIGLRFKSGYGPSRFNFRIFDEPNATDDFNILVMRAVFSDAWPDNAVGAQYLRDLFARETQLAMGQPSSHGKWVHLYLNGLYWGIYDIAERVDADFAASYFGGEAEDYDGVKHGEISVYEVVDGDNVAWTNALGLAAAGLTANNDYAAFMQVVDVTNMIDYMMLNFYLANYDWPGKNWWANRRREPGAGWRFYCWDTEYTLYDINADRLWVNDAEKPSYLYAQAKENAEFRLTFADRAHKHMFNDGVLQVASNIARYSAASEEIYGSIMCESARWGDNPDSRFGTNLNYTHANWLATRTTITTTFFPLRHSIFLDQLKASNLYPNVSAPVFYIDGTYQHGGSVTSGDTFSMSNGASDAIYYTFDGSDPREWGTGYTNGTLYAGGILLTNNSLVKSRAVSNHVWSALNESVFTIDTLSPLRITEIMYRPRAPQSGTGETNYSRSDFEFIELKNTSGSEIGLAGLRFVDGVRFDFTYTDSASSTNMLGAGEQVVLVRNFNAFTNRYTNWASINIAGTFHGPLFQPVGTLADAGENLSLVDSLGRVILDFDYEDDWYPHTDGEGYSLTIQNPLQAPSTWSSKQSWRGSATIDGSPGESNPSPLYEPGTIVINEALTHQDQDNPGDWIELYNASTVSVSITDWYLSDNENDLTKYRITNSVTLNLGEHFRFTEFEHFGTNAQGTNAFALSEHGESIYLSYGTNGALAEPSYREYVDFGAAESDMTFGRYVKTDLSTDFTTMDSATPNATNSDPLIGPIVINEIMYNPPANGHEYIELVNISGSTVPLYNPAHTTNAWKLDGTGFMFPLNISMTNGEVMFLVRNTITTNAFRSMKSIPAHVDIYSYDGSLDNGGERLRVMKPVNPDESGVPYVTVDHVNYKDALPWPVAADGTGLALKKISSALYGNDAYNWTTSSGGGPWGANAIPYMESFESYSDGFQILGTKGWYTPYPTVGFVVTNDYTNSFGGELPLDGDHTLVLDVTDSAGDEESITNNFINTESHSNVWVDMMVEGDYRKPGDIEALDANAQLAFCINTNGNLCVWNDVGASNGWTVLSGTDIAENEWFRLTTEFDYTRDPTGFRVYTNRVLVTNTWLDCANTNNKYFSELEFLGDGNIDDLVVADWNTVSALTQWLRQNYPSEDDYNAVAASDTDSDGMAASNEYYSGTIPTDRDSLFKVLIPTDIGAGQSRITWQSVTSRYYTVYKSTNLVEGWMEPPLISNLLGTADTTFIDNNTSTNDKAFYLIKTEAQ